MMLYGLDLFSGIGGITEALSEWVQPIAYCESDRYAQGVLLSRMAKGQLPRAPIWNDVRTLSAKHLPQGIEILYGGFPCQDISVAGNRAGITGKHSSLISEVWRLVDEVRPPYIFLENSPAIITNGFDTILASLAERGFDARWLCLSASDVGACHIRNRWWLLAHTNEQRQLQPARCITQGRGWSSNCTQEVDSARSVGWPTVSAFRGADDGMPNASNRIAALGHAVVPQCAKEAFRILISTQ